jgi:hypothetical protein
MEFDFAENFSVPQQDQIQAAYYKPLSLSLFTCCTWFRGECQSYVIVSESLEHHKEQILPYVLRILEMSPEEVQHVNIWTDGPYSQFKNRFVAHAISCFVNNERFQPMLKLKSIMWNFFATSHGKGAVDGIGAVVKTEMRKKILARKVSINCARDFVAAHSGSIQVLEMEKPDFDFYKKKYDLQEIFENSPKMNGKI